MTTSETHWPLNYNGEATMGVAYNKREPATAVNWSSWVCDVNDLCTSRYNYVGNGAQYDQSYYHSAKVYRVPVSNMMLSTTC